MSVQGGQLLVVRRRITLAPGETTVNTGIRQANVGVDPDPPVGGTDPTVMEPDGVSSRVMVIPLAPIDAWLEDGLINNEPRLDTDTGTVVVDFVNNGDVDVEVNVLFVDPHTLIGPVDAQTYLRMECTAPTSEQTQGGVEDSGGTNSINFALPSPIADADLVLLYVQVGLDTDFASADTMPAPDDMTGWTTAFEVEIDQGGGAGFKAALYWRIGSGGFASYPVSIDPGATGGMCGVILEWSGNFDPLAPFTLASAPNIQSTPENPLSIDSPVIDVPEETALPGLYLAFFGSPAATSPFFLIPGSVDGGQINNSTLPGAMGGYSVYDVTVDGPTTPATISQPATNTVGYVHGLVLPGVCNLVAGSVTFGLTG